jgi:cardiolipin synthase
MPWMALGLFGCAAAPSLPAPPTPSKVTASVGVVAQQVNVTGHQGQQLDRKARVQVLAQVGAQGKAEAMRHQLAAMASFGEIDLYSGNSASLLIDGPATFAAMFDAIKQAKHTIFLESYIIDDAAISRQLAALLAQRRRHGVQVFVMYDAIGSLGTQQNFFDELRQAGVAVCAFNPINPAAGQRDGSYFDITHRDHRKILVIDRALGFTGGINISSVYSSGSLGRTHRQSNVGGADQAGWRDTQIQIRGPAAVALDELVRTTWQQQRCATTPASAMPAALPELPKALGQQLIRIVPATPDDPVNRIYAMLLSAIGAARDSIHLTMAYFAPGDDMVEALCAAALRGVDVQLVLPSHSDFAPVLHAGRSRYDKLLSAGVQIHELRDAVLHAKTAVIDGVVSTVGSSNMDWRSFTANNEVNAVVIGEDFGQAMETMFRQDVKVSQGISLEAWRDRSVWQRGKEFFARLFERWW